MIPLKIISLVLMCLLFLDPSPESFSQIEQHQCSTNLQAWSVFDPGLKAPNSVNPKRMRIELGLISSMLLRNAPAHDINAMLNMAYSKTPYCRMLNIIRTSVLTENKKTFIVELTCPTGTEKMLSLTLTEGGEEKKRRRTIRTAPFQPETRTDRYVRDILKKIGFTMENAQADLYALYRTIFQDGDRLKTWDHAVLLKFLWDTNVPGIPMPANFAVKLAGQRNKLLRRQEQDKTYDAAKIFSTLAGGRLFSVYAGSVKRNITETSEENVFVSRCFHREFPEFSGRGLSQIESNTTIRAYIEKMIRGKKTIDILDLGCGPAGQAAKDIKNIYGAAVNVRGVNSVIREQTGGDVALRIADIRNGLPYAGGSFDLIYEACFIGQFHGKEFDALLKESMRVLRPGGVFIITSAWPNEMPIVEKTLTKLNIRWKRSKNYKLPIIITKEGIVPRQRNNITDNTANLNDGIYDARMIANGNTENQQRIAARMAQILFEAFGQAEYVHDEQMILRRKASLILGVEENRVRLAVKDGMIVGLVEFSHQQPNKTPKINKLAVLPGQHQNTGIGTQLMDAAINAFLENDPECAFFGIDPGYLAEGFYEKYFSKRGENSKYNNMPWYLTPQEPVISGSLDQEAWVTVSINKRQYCSKQEKGETCLDIEKITGKTGQLLAAVNACGGGNGQLDANSEQVDMFFDLTLFSSRSKEDLRENIRTLARIILLCRHFPDINFIIETPFAVDKQSMPPGLVNDIQNAADKEQFIETLKKEIKHISWAFNISGADAEKIIEYRVNRAKRKNAIEITIWSKAWYEWLKKTRPKDSVLDLNQYPIAMDEYTDINNTIALRDLEGALALGLSKVLLVAAKRKDTKRKDNKETEFLEVVEKKQMISRIQKLFDTGFGKKNKKKITLNTLRTMVFDGATTRADQAIELALPPITCMKAEALKALHERIQIFLQAT